MTQSALPRYRLIFEKARLGMMVLGKACVVVEANEAMSRLTGWPRDELVGRKACAELFAADWEDQSTCVAICQSHAPGAGTGPAEPHRLLLHTRQGAEVPVMISTAQVPLADSETGLALFVWDVSQAERTERELEHRRRQAEELAAIGREIAAASDINQQMEPVLTRARRLLNMDLAAWGTFDEQTRCVTWEAASGRGSYALRGAHMALEGSLMGKILLQGRTYLTMNLTAEQAGNQPVCQLFSQPAFATAVIIPFALEEDRQGALLCASQRRIALGEEDVLIASHLGSYLATAVEKGLLLEEVRRFATLEERQRIAAEMHDGFGQTLTYLGLRLHLIGKYAERGRSAEIVQEVASLKAVLQDAHQQVREAIYALKSSAPAGSLALRWQRMLTDFTDRTGIQTDCQIEPGAADGIADLVQAQLTRILQEALANVRNHSGACRVTVTVCRAGGELRMAISDDGCGFDPEQVQGAEGRHFGLTLMSERAAGIGAALEIRSRRGYGTTVMVRWSYRLEGKRYESVADSHSPGR